MDEFIRLVQYYNETGLSMAIVFCFNKPDNFIGNIKLEYYLHGEVNRLDSILRDAENTGIEVLLFTPLPGTGESRQEAIMDRIKQLAGIK